MVFPQNCVTCPFLACVQSLPHYPAAKRIDKGLSSPVRRIPKKGLRQVDFVFEGTEIRGLEQNPQTKSRWAQLARSGKKVMQFISEGATSRTWSMGW